MNTNTAVIHVRKEQAGKATNVHFQRGTDGQVFTVSGHVLREIGHSVRGGIHRVINAAVSMTDDEVLQRVAAGDLAQFVINKAQQDRSRPVDLSTLLR